MTLSTILLQAEGAPAPQGGGWTFIVMMVMIFVVMYLFMIRPQKKRQKELTNFRNTLQNGTKVITAGGIYGTVREVTDDSVLVEVDNGVKIRVVKSMVMRDPADMMQR